jgi:valyl-tRNA synthetase
MEEIRDWCISRQLWWGHRIPVWYCKGCSELTVSVEEPKACSNCGSTAIEQDPDVLDTWFSSALWPHSTLGWPDDTEDFRYFYPTSVMETGYDILFFWVARMIMMGLEDTGEIPFHTVYLHGLIRDEKGEKMSKVRGNVLNPLVALEKYGTDALRFALSTGTSPGNDIKLAPSRMEAGRNFANKLWNATRFIVRSVTENVIDMEIQRSLLLTEDRWILSRLNCTVRGVTGLMEDFQFGEAQRQIYDFLWGEFCDWYIEFAKIRLRSAETPSPVPVLVHVLETSLRLLHPYMPFVTEELWQNLRKHTSPGEHESIMVSPYPEADEVDTDPDAERIINVLIEIVRSIRNVRAQYKVERNRWVEAEILADNQASAIADYAAVIETLARAKPITFLAQRREEMTDEKALAMVLEEAEVFIPMASVVDLDVERKRLQKETDQVQAEVSRLEARLRDESFLTKAPVAVVDKERLKLNALTEKLERLKRQLV